ncbi:MAG: DUF5615 family PIN-like protein [Proteobacteria bacterium]|nr:DUF5615 family PIN-like protein [Pseudomonadota bacterium]
MKFLIDNQLPRNLTTFIRSKGYDSKHVSEIGLSSARDIEIYRYAVLNDYIIISKDEDFFHLVNNSKDVIQLLWVRLGNCRSKFLNDYFNLTWHQIVEYLNAKERIIQLQ